MYAHDTPAHTLAKILGGYHVNQRTGLAAEGNVVPANFFSSNAQPVPSNLFAPASAAPAYAPVTPAYAPAGYAPATPGQVVPAPAYAPAGYAPATPGQVVPAPAYAPVTPGQVVPAPAYAPATPGQVVPAPGYAPATPGQVVPAPGYAPAPASNGGRDQYGCFASAGYAWCPTLNQCVQPWVTPCPSLPAPAPMPAPMPAPIPAPVPAPAPGSGRDAHGCIPSAGYTWCPLTQSCVRVWETPCVDQPVPAPPPHPAPIGKHTDTHGCNMAAGYAWCPNTRQCQKYADTPCLPLGPGGVEADQLEPPEPIIPLNPQAPTNNICDFSSPFFCTASQEVAFDKLPAVSMGGDMRACVLPVASAGDVGCDVLSAGECGLRGGAFIADAQACPKDRSIWYHQPYVGTVTAGALAQSAQSGHYTPMLGFFSQ